MKTEIYGDLTTTVTKKVFLGTTVICDGCKAPIPSRYEFDLTFEDQWERDNDRIHKHWDVCSVKCAIKVLSEWSNE